jgi:hypothetical protein
MMAQRGLKHELRAKVRSTQQLNILFPILLLVVIRRGAAIEPLRSGSPCGVQKLLTDLPVVFGLLYVNGPLAASENGSRQTALQDGSACDYDPRAEQAGPTLLTGTSNKDRETMRDIMSAGRRDTSWCRVLPIDFMACSPPANAHLEFCNHALLPADWTTGFYPHHEVAINY